MKKGWFMNRIRKMYLDKPWIREEMRQNALRQQMQDALDKSPLTDIEREKRKKNIEIEEKISTNS